MINVRACRYKKKGGKSWYCKMDWKYEDGTKGSESKSTGIPVAGNNIRKADKRIEEMRLAKEAELNAKPEPKGLLFSNWLTHWLKIKRRTIRESTYDSYVTNVGIISQYFDERNITLEQIKASDIQGFYLSLLDKGLTGKTIQRYHTNINNAVNMAIAQGLIFHNPMLGIALPPKEQKEKKLFSVEEVNKVLDALEGEDIKTAVYIAAYCGVRRSEVLGLYWSDIDWDNRSISIHRTRTKVSKEICEDKTKSKTSRRPVYFDDALERILKEEKARQVENAILLGSAYHGNHDFICRYADGRKLRADYVTDHFQLILQRLGLKGFCFHRLRDTFASHLVNSGSVAVTTARDILGHASITTTNCYLLKDENQKRKAANIYSDMLGRK